MIFCTKKRNCGELHFSFGEMQKHITALYFFCFLRQAKNIFISSTALTTRHAIAGGLDIETAYQLSDSYIQEAEKAIKPQY